jgi:hypothetical protein
MPPERVFPPGTVPARGTELKHPFELSVDNEQAFVVE